MDDDAKDPRGGRRSGSGRPKGAPNNPVPAGEMSHAEARRRTQQALAQIREEELAELRGALVRAADVGAAVTAVHAQLRSALERVPDKLADVVAAESDPAAVHALLTAEIDLVLEDLAADVHRLEAPHGKP